MNEWLTFEEAWDKFHSARNPAPSAGDKERVREITTHFGSKLFKLTSNYMRDESNTIHVNPGFVVTKGGAPHVTPDSTYSDEGFTHRLDFSNAGAHRNGAEETPTPVKWVCGLCLSEDHRTEECPDHPSNR